MGRRELADRFGHRVKNPSGRSDATFVDPDRIVADLRRPRVRRWLGLFGRLLVVAAVAVAAMALVRRPSGESLAAWTVAGDAPASAPSPAAPVAATEGFSWRLDPPSSAAESLPPGGTAQDVAVPIGRGRLSATPQRQTVVLHPSRTGGSYVGSLTPVTVIDARGSLDGWTATLRLNAPSASGPVRFTPASPRAVTGNQAEVAVGHPGTLTTDAPLVIGYANSGGGGGTFVVDGRLSIDRDADAGTGDVTVDVLVTVQ